MKRCFAKLSLLLMLAIALPAVAQDSASQNRSGSRIIWRSTKKMFR